MIQANTVLEAWDKTFETMDFSHLAQYLSEDFQVEYTTGEVDNLEDTKSWCVAGGLRINNFKTIRENENYIVATHEVVQEGKISAVERPSEELRIVWVNSLVDIEHAACWKKIERGKIRVLKHIWTEA